MRRSLWVAAVEDVQHSSPSGPGSRGSAATGLRSPPLRYRDHSLAVTGWMPRGRMGRPGGWRASWQAWVLQAGGGALPRHPWPTVRHSFDARPPRCPVSQRPPCEGNLYLHCPPARARASCCRSPLNGILPPRHDHLDAIWMTWRRPDAAPMASPASAATATSTS